MTVPTRVRRTKALPGLSGVTQVDFSTTDPDAAYEFLHTNYGDNLQLSGLVPGDKLALTRHDLGRVCITRLRSLGVLRWEAGRLDRLVVCQPLSGTQERETMGCRDRLGPGDVALIAPPDRPVRGANRKLSNQAVAVDLELLAEVAGNDPQQSRSVSPEFRECRPLSDSDAEQWRRIIQIIDEVVAIPATEDLTLVCRHAERLIAAAALTLLPNSAITEPTSIDRNDATPLTLRRAVAYVSDHAGDDISVGDVAAAASVTVRAVQLAFRRHLNTTPMRHVRQVRLERAHEELIAADPSRGETVSDIAARWGFFSPGRFSADYRERFGTAPSNTLRS